MERQHNAKLYDESAVDLLERKLAETHQAYEAARRALREAIKANGELHRERDTLRELLREINDVMQIKEPTPCPCFICHRLRERITAALKETKIIQSRSNRESFPSQESRPDIVQPNDEVKRQMAGSVQPQSGECAARKALHHCLQTKHDVRTCACVECEDARAALAQPCPAPQSNLTREQAENMAREMHWAGVEDRVRMIADALQSVAGSQDTKQMHMDICNLIALLDAHIENTGEPLDDEDNAVFQQTKASYPVRAAIESEEEQR